MSTPPCTAGLHPPPTRVAWHAIAGKNRNAWLYSRTQHQGEVMKAQTAPYGIFMLRVGMGLLFLAHAGAKIFVITIPGFVKYFASLGLPPIVAYAVLALEIVGGLALVLGTYASLVSIPLAIEILGTIYFVHFANGWAFTAKGGGWEFPALWAVALISLFLLGEGAWALAPVRRSRA
jgi:putative oxidoreductase